MNPFVVSEENKEMVLDKLIFDKFVMKNYRFDVSTYRYLNDHDFQKYSGIIDYVKDIAVRL